MNNDVEYLIPIVNPHYDGLGVRQLLTYGKYRGYNFYVVDDGSFPHCFVAVRHTHPLICIDKHWRRTAKVQCHGGITFAGKLKDFRYDGFMIGWDYSQPGDYVESWSGTNGGKPFAEGHKYTTDEMMVDVINVIDQLSEYETIKAEHNG